MFENPLVLAVAATYAVVVGAGWVWSRRKRNLPTLPGPDTLTAMSDDDLMRVANALDTPTSDYEVRRRIKIMIIEEIERRRFRRR